MSIRNQTPGVRLRIVIEPGIALGPGKADLLEGIDATGSIAAAGRRMGMSYKRAWTLVEIMNGDFGTALVSTTKGGKSHGGAALTPTGREVLTLYRRMETRAARIAEDDLTALRQIRAAGAG